MAEQRVSIKPAEEKSEAPAKVTSKNQYVTKKGKPQYISIKPAGEKSGTGGSE
jgi:hypothetical protein